MIPHTVWSAVNYNPDRELILSLRTDFPLAEQYSSPLCTCMKEIGVNRACVLESAVLIFVSCGQVCQ